MAPQRCTNLIPTRGLSRGTRRVKATSYIAGDLVPLKPVRSPLTGEHQVSLSYRFLRAQHGHQTRLQSPDLTP